MIIKKILSYLSGSAKTKEFNNKTVASPMVKQISSELNSNFPLDEIQQNIFNTIKTTNNNIFIHGQAGTGKSTFVQYLKEKLPKRIKIVCPTAVAAINIGGVTVHSLFYLPTNDFCIINKLQLTRKTQEILTKTDLLIIDEVSMIRPDILDAIDYLSKKARRNREPFGGLQILLIGDLLQLPPVIKSSVYDIFKQKYGHKESYFFDSDSYKNANFQRFELTKVYRQSDINLLQNLINIRNYKNIEETIKFFNSCKIYDIDILKKSITITPYNKVAEYINQQKLEELKTKSFTYKATVMGSFNDEDSYPAPENLTLKKGALVIFNKNNYPLWINGSSGIIEELHEDEIKVRILKDNSVVIVLREVWKNFSYEHDEKTDEIIEQEIGSFIQFPLQLGYALTIHKAQGKTLDKVILDIGRGAFAHGQLYVALSRTRRKEDMHIKKELFESDIILDERVMNFLLN